MKLIDGKQISAQIKAEAAEEAGHSGQGESRPVWLLFWSEKTPPLRYM